VIIQIIGSLSLGIVIGWLVRYFIRRFKTFTPQALGSVVSIMVGGGLVKFLGANQTVLFCYPIGLLLGFVGYTLIAIILIIAMTKWPFLKEKDFFDFFAHPTIGPH